MKFKFIAAILGMTIAIPVAVWAQSAGDSDPYSKPSPNIAMQQEPNDQGSNGQASSDQPEQDSMGPGMAPDTGDTGAMNQPSLNQNSSPSYGGSESGANDGGPSYNTSAPEEKNGVARISLIHGDVSTQRGDSKDWSAAALNAPVLAGDRVSTGDRARAEIQLDYANMLRLAEHSQANITQLNKSQIQVQLGHGMANYSVFKNSDADAEIDTPNVAIRTERREASFRILVTADDHTEVLVRKGEIEVTTPQGGTRVGQNQYITIQGTGADEQYKIGEAPARENFDQWNSDRDGMIRNSIARRHTNDYYVGSEDLDGHGQWSEVPDYGQVWRPNVAAGWAPYRDGRWVYEPYWGWTWVSYDSWGWAPYHYGRWLQDDAGWGWWPGPSYGYPFYRPIWAPAYVSFFGFGGGFGFGFGGWGNVGWLPLGPCDRFHPWWGGYGRFGAAGWGGYNRGGFAPLHGGSRFSNVNLAMHDRNFRGGTTVSGREFGTGHMHAQALNHAQFSSARFSTGHLPMSPGRESFSASGRPAAASTTRNVSQNQHFFSSPNRSVNSGANRMTGANGREGGGARTGSTGSNARVGNQGFERSGQGSNSARPGISGGSTTAREGNGGGWQKFTPMAPRSSSESRSKSGRGDAGRGYNGQSGGRPGSSAYGSRGSDGRGYSSENRGYGSEGRSGYGASSRPSLNMRQPIVTPRSYGGGGYGGSPYGGRSMPGYGGPRSAPSYGGGHSAPSYGGGHSAPSSHGGGGSSHGGGASHGGGSSDGGGGGLD